MKRSILPLVLLVAFAGCNDDGTVQPEAPEAKVFQVHLQDGFWRTPVSVFVDQRAVFADTVSTNLVLSLAAIIPVQVSQGTHALWVAIPGVASSGTSFTIVDTLFAGVSYSATTRQFDFRFQRSPFYYR